MEGRKERDIVLLAISYKKDRNGKPGLCVAGIDLVSHEYIRLCDPIDGISSLPCYWSYGTGVPFILDIIHVSLSEEPVISGSQCENYRLYSATYVGEYPREKIDELYSTLPHSDYVFLNNQAMVPHSQAISIKHSLELFKVSNLTIRHDGKKHYASFKYNDVDYFDVSLTDCIYCGYPERFGTEWRCTNKDAYIMVSMPADDEFIINGGNHYKWVAGVIKTPSHKKYCIRCHSVIPASHDAEIPYCSKDYHTWLNWSNGDYLEKSGVCYDCGSRATVSKNRPRCPKCELDHQNGKNKRV